MSQLALHPDRLFPSEPTIRGLARELYQSVANLPILSPHGHTDPAWFANDQAFSNPAELLIKPDHYVYRMLYSQGISLEQLGIETVNGDTAGLEQDPRKIWRLFAENYHLFSGTPSHLWHDWVYSEVFKIDVRLSADTADLYYDRIDSALNTDEFRPRRLFERYNIELIATTEDPLDPLVHHQKLKADGWGDKVITAFRPDNVLDPEYENFVANVRALGDVSGCDITTYDGYLRALENRRAYFKDHGATSSDHGHPNAYTHKLSHVEASDLYQTILSGDTTPEQAQIWRGHMLLQMARMSLADGLTMQIHPGSYRNHNQPIFEKFGRDKGADIPTPTDYVNDLRALLGEYGNESKLTIILFTLDETSYSRELATLAGHYPALRLGPPWWFHDSPEGMRRFREQVTETAGFYNTVGFNDDTRAFLSIPARHDVARRMDCVWLAQLLSEHRITEEDAYRVAQDLSYNLAKAAYHL